MDIRHLRYFLAVVDAGGFTAAARRLGMAQPPISIQTRALEEELGVKLFTREGRRATLTATGRALVPEAREIIARMDRLGTELRDADRGRTGLIRVGVSTEARTGWLSRRLRKFGRAHRGLRIELTDLSDAEEFPANLDVAIQCAAKTSVASGNHVLEVSRCGLALDPKHRLASRAEASASDLIGETLLVALPETLCAAEQIARTILAGIGATWKPAGDFERRLWVAAAGQGVAVCSQQQFEQTRLKLAFVPFSSPDARVTTVCRVAPAARSALTGNLASALGAESADVRSPQ